MEKSAYSRLDNALAELEKLPDDTDRYVKRLVLTARLVIGAAMEELENNHPFSDHLITMARSELRNLDA